MYLLITGGFDPIHSGHLNAFNTAAGLGSLVVGLNSDAWLIRKKGARLLPYSERKAIVNSFITVNSVLDPWDDEDGSACAAIRQFHSRYKDKRSPMMFVNGGDRTPAGVNIKEFDLCSSLGIISVFGVGGDKTASSSNFLGDYVQTMLKK